MEVAFGKMDEGRAMSQRWSLRHGE